MKFFVVLLLALSAIPSSTLAAGEITQWRNDGTGVYPQAKPPVTWQRTSKAIEGLRFQSAPPDADKPSGKPMADGVIREWLVAGPFDAAADSLYADDQSKLAPVADAQWKAAPTDTSFLDFARQFNSYGKLQPQVAYAHTYVYSPADAPVIMNLQHSDAAAVWLNGKLTHNPKEKDLNYTPQYITLKKGWNKILIRSTPAKAKAEAQSDGIWYINVSFRGAPGKSEFTEKNIRWKTNLPASDGAGAPIVVAGKIFLLSESADLVCLDANTGKILWIRSNNYDEVATDEEKKANPDVFKEIEPLQAQLKAINDSFSSATPPRLETIDGREIYKPKAAAETRLYSLMRKVDDKKYTRPKGQDVGYAGFTPISDGKHVWAWFANGVLCCFDLEGKVVWRRLDNEGSFFEHGYSTSPVMADGKILVFMNKLMAFDAATGNRLWTTPLSGIALTRFHGTPAVARLGDGKDTVCILPTGHIVRMSDGKIIHDKGPEISARQQEIPSPVVIRNTVYELSTFNPFNRVTLPAQLADPLPVTVKNCRLDVSRYPTYYLDWFLASPLIHDGLAYCVNNTGVLVVVDVETMQPVYEKLLDLDQFQNSNEGHGRGAGVSPTLAGGNIYIMGDAGATLVLKPGRTYQQLAKNKIESIIHRNWQDRTERFVASPAFDGKRMFIRGERYLYCIAE